MLKCVSEGVHCQGYHVVDHFNPCAVLIWFLSGLSWYFNIYQYCGFIDNTEIEILCNSSL